MTERAFQVIEAQLLGDAQDALSFDIFCAQLHSPAETVEALVAYGVVHPRGRAPEEWRFSVGDLRKARIGMRLCRDLELNWAGAALVLELLERMEDLERQITGVAVPRRG